MNVIDKITQEQKRTDIPKFEIGDNIDVHVRVVEGDKERIQVFTGTVIQQRGSGQSAMFTVRKISAGIGVERIFPFNSPMIAQVKKNFSNKVRRSKLYYLRKLRGKASRLKRQYQ